MEAGRRLEECVDPNCLKSWPEIIYLVGITQIKEEYKYIFLFFLLSKKGMGGVILGYGWCRDYVTHLATCETVIWGIFFR